MVKAVLNNENEILTVSTYLNGNYGHEGLYIGIPAIISNEGIKETLDIQLSPDEQAKFDNSFALLEEMKKEINQIIE